MDSALLAATANDLETTDPLLHPLIPIDEEEEAQVTILVME